MRDVFILIYSSLVYLMTRHVSPQSSRHPLHYGWIVMLVGMLTVLGSLGFARFGYTMILPSMQEAKTAKVHFEP